VSCRAAFPSPRDTRLEVERDFRFVDIWQEVQKLSHTSPLADQRYAISSGWKIRWPESSTEGMILLPVAGTRPRLRRRETFTAYGRALRSQNRRLVQDHRHIGKATVLTFSDYWTRMLNIYSPILSARFSCPP
jgi:hypothetical protein